jgi:AraC-like DNA-binding protein
MDLRAPGRPPFRKTRFRRSFSGGPAVRVRPVFDDFHLLEVRARHEYPLHQHANYELILVEQGPYLCLLNGRELQLDAGSILVIKPGDRHSDHLRPGQRHFVLHFHLERGAAGEAVVDLFRSSVNPRLQVCRGRHQSELALLHELQREAESGAEFASAVQDSLLEALFWRTVRHLAPGALSPALRRLPQRELLRERIGQLFQDHVTEACSATEFASMLGVSRRQFQELCRRHFGMSPARLFLQARIHRAGELLRTGLRVKEVSEQLGFANPYHFSRAYRRITGVPPSTHAQA